MTEFVRWPRRSKYDTILSLLVSLSSCVFKKEEPDWSQKLFSYLSLLSQTTTCWSVWSQLIFTRKYRREKRWWSTFRSSERKRLFFFNRNKRQQKQSESVKFMKYETSCSVWKTIRAIWKCFSWNLKLFSKQVLKSDSTSLKKKNWAN